MNHERNIHAITETSASQYPCGPCKLPLVCCNCGEIITEDNANNDSECEDGCDICQYCGVGKCMNCGTHWHCGGCI